MFVLLGASGEFLLLVCAVFKLSHASLFTHALPCLLLALACVHTPPSNPQVCAAFLSQREHLAWNSIYTRQKQRGGRLLHALGPHASPGSVKHFARWVSLLAALQHPCSFPTGTQHQRIPDVSSICLSFMQLGSAFVPHLCSVRPFSVARAVFHHGRIFRTPLLPICSIYAS